jgi:hypothetical protein
MWCRLTTCSRAAAIQATHIELVVSKTCAVGNTVVLQQIDIGGVDRALVRTPDALSIAMERLQAWCTPGMKLEVIMTEDGLAGSRYVGKVMSMKKCSALVEFEVCAHPPSLSLGAVCVDVDGCFCDRSVCPGLQ